MAYKDERIKMAVDNVKSKSEILNEAKRAHSEARTKLAKTIETVFIEKIAKPGEIIYTKWDHIPYYFDHIEDGIYGYIELVCHPQKNDGTPSRSIRKMMVSDFADL